MSDKGMTTIALKKINKNNVYQFIYREKTTSKLMIVQKLQMGLSTVSQNLKLLEEEGLIVKKGYFDSTGGRKAQALQIVGSARISLGLGILKDLVLIAAVDLYGNALFTASISLPYKNAEWYYQRLGHEIEGFIDENKIERSAILGISVATQGIISPDGKSVSYGKIMENSHMHLSDFASHIPYPCHLDHDSKAAAYLELWKQRELDSAVVFLLNKNLGGAVITNHRIHHGLTMHSGTIEHLCIDPDGPDCYCGCKGCLETFCSGNALEKKAGVSIPSFFGELREKNNSDFNEIWENYKNRLAFAMRNLSVVIDGPIIISGYMAPFFTEEDISYLINKIQISSPFPFERERIIVGTHGQYTPAIGAALFYIEQFLGTV